MSHTKNIWLLSAYRSQSHGTWADWLCNTLTDINWHILELPGRHFRWRIRGNPLSWLDKLPSTKPDMILATSMVDIATIKGLHPELSTVPVIYYFHENQFAYPSNELQHTSVDPQMVQLYAALSANELLFNSAYNRDSFLSGIDKLLGKLPDEVPENIVQRLQQKSDILPVPVSPVHANKKNPELILWNHRWEYDKAPVIFYEALVLLKNADINFQLALLGERATRKPESLKNIEQDFADHIFINEKVNKETYNKILSQSAMVVSSAIHEFQGLSMLEAVSAGAIPVVPDDLCYREQYAEQFRYNAGSPQALADIIRQYLVNPVKAPDVSAWYSEVLQPAWQAKLSS